MSKERELLFAKKTGWHRLGVMETDVKIKLSDAEKMLVGAEQAEALLAIRGMEEEKKEFDAAIKGRIQEKETFAHDTALLLKAGYRIERKPLPCFVDPKKRQRVFVDVDTGEEVSREPMHSGDMQLGLAT